MLQLPHCAVQFKLLSHILPACPPNGGLYRCMSNCWREVEEPPCLLIPVHCDTKLAQGVPVVYAGMLRALAAMSARDGRQ